MKTVIGIVIYQAAIQYIDDLIDSINNQDYHDFNLLLINDDINSNELSQKLSRLNVEIALIHFEKRYSPIELRIKLFEEAKKKKSELLIMCDADDKFSSDRVSAVIKCFEDNPEYSFFYNEVYYFDGNKSLPDMPDKTLSIDNVLDYNYLGLSNTAIRVEALSSELISRLQGCNHMVFDWYLYSILLLDGQKGIFVPKAKTYYRTHNNNIVGNQRDNAQKIEYEVSVKKKHYDSLKEFHPLFYDRFKKYYGGNYELSKKDNDVFWWGYTHPQEQ